MKPPKKSWKGRSHGFSYNFFCPQQLTTFRITFMSVHCFSHKFFFPNLRKHVYLVYRLCMYHDHHVQVVRTRAHKIHAHAIVQEKKGVQKVVYRQKAVMDKKWYKSWARAVLGLFWGFNALKDSFRSFKIFVAFFGNCPLKIY